MTKINILLQREEPVSVVSDFFQTFRDEFFDSLLCGLVLVGVALLFGYVFWFYQTMAVGGNAAVTLLRAMTALPLVLCYCAACYLWVMNAVVELSFGPRLRNALSLTVVSLRSTLFCLAAGLLFGSLAALQSVPMDLYEAAAVDGANAFVRFRVVTMMLPGIASTLIFDFVNLWNELFSANLFLDSDNLKTVTVGLNALIQKFDIAWGEMMAGTIISIIPTVILFALLRKYMIAGLTSGAVKG